MGPRRFGRPRNQRLVALGASVLAALFALGVFTTWWRHLRPPLTGDEPHYLVIAHSIAIDHDLDLRNDYPQFDSIYPPRLPIGHHAVAMRSDKRLRPIQGLGLGFILAPAWLITSRPAHALEWARFIMILIAAGLVGETHWLARKLAPDRPASAWAASAALTVSLPFVGYSNQFYPEIPAAFLAVTALIAIRRSTLASRVVVGTCAGSLLWMSPRYTPIAAGLVAWQVLTDARAATGVRRFAVAAGNVLLPAFILTVLLGGWYLHAFDTLSLERVYRAAHIPIAHSAFTVYVRSAGSLFDPVGGLLPYAPVLLLGVIGLGALWRANRNATGLVCVVGLVYFVAFAPAGFRGYALTVRMAIITIPILGLGIAALMRRAGRASVVVLVVLGAISVAITVQCAHREIYGRLYKTNVVPASPIVAHVASIWPRFTPEPATTPTGEARPASHRNAPIRDDIPVTGVWIAALGTSAILAARKSVCATGRP